MGLLSRIAGLRRRPIITHSALAVLLALAAGHGVNWTFGCGPDFPNNLLQGGDAPLLTAPVGDFSGELLRRNLVPTRLKAVPAEGGNAAQAAEADVADLEAALKKSNSSKADFNRIRSAYQTNRARLRRFVEDLEQWKDSGLWVYDEEGSHREAPTAPPPVLPQLDNPEGLPPEFSDYLEGAVAWQNPAVTDKSAARHAWERLLGRPADERPFKSTWAAFMLGRSWEKEDPQKAAQYYRQVRELAAARFADRAGLAAASLGLEARIALAEKHYEHALELYLEQFAAGDPTAVNSLTWVAQQVLGSAASSEDLEPLARNPRTREILTAYLVSRTWEDYTTSLAWLEAVEAAGVRDAASAEKLALAAYQANEIALAERWIKRAPASPLTQWLQAKLFLRAGKTDQAAALLSRVSRSFPILPPPSANNPPPPTLQANLRMNETDFLYGRVTASRQVLGELGAFRLARRDYAQALDALLRAGFWMDAAYVAERVLTLDELKTYVNQFWPAVSAQTAAAEEEEYGKSAISPAVSREKIRYLLARRLVRNIRGDEARDYYPELRVGSFDLLAANLRSGWEESLPPDERARGLFAAAIITRTNGLELLGTEVQPDWAIHDGNFEEGVTWEDRSTNTVESFVHASPDEIQRASSHNADPETRWHYRWQAASLAWTAAGLMPNNSEDTALVLCRGGTWLKGVDPAVADYFYKALVWRNRHTALGAEADRLRWFPRLDANGQWVPHVEPEPEPVMEAPPESMADPNLEIDSPEPPEADTEAASPLPGTPEETPPGYYYIIRKGDSLAAVARAFANAGVAVTPAQMRAANPGLDEARLKVGQKLFIPWVETDR